MIRVLSFTTFYFILCISCTPPIEFSSRRAGINPENLNQKAGGQADNPYR